jgi:hypothetical protein
MRAWLRMTVGEVVVVGRSGTEEITIDQLAKNLDSSPAKFMVDLRRIPLRYF